MSSVGANPSSTLVLTLDPPENTDSSVRRTLAKEQDGNPSPSSPEGTLPLQWLVLIPRSTMVATPTSEEAASADGGASGRPMQCTSRRKEARVVKKKG